MALFVECISTNLNLCSFLEVGSWKVIERMPLLVFDMTSLTRNAYLRSIPIWHSVGLNLYRLRRSGTVQQVEIRSHCGRSRPVISIFWSAFARLVVSAGQMSDLYFLLSRHGGSAMAVILGM